MVAKINSGNMERGEDKMDDCVSKLMAIKIDDVHKIPKFGKVIPARLIEITDGDTAHVIILMGDEPMKLNIRICGIDAPETKLGDGRSQLHKDAGLKVKKYVCGLYNGINIVYIKIVDLDKYCRYVAEMYLPQTSSSGDMVTLSKHLIDKKYAKVYDGKKAKEVWSVSDLEYIMRN